MRGDRRRGIRWPWPDKTGHFGEFGGRFVPETLMAPLYELEEGYREVRKDKSFWKGLDSYLQRYAGRPTPLFEAEKLGEACGMRVFLKREDLAHTGSHKINNCIGQALLARRLRKKRIIAETGAGQHGVAVATVCALLGFPCVIYMGEEDIQRQALNVFRMKLLGAEVVAVRSGTRTLKDAINEALRDWVTNVDSTYYLLGSVVGPHPFPLMVRDFQSVIGKETKAQFQEIAGRLPDCLIACVGGGSNAIGFFYPFIQEDVSLIGVEAGGDGERHAASLSRGSPGVLHGSRMYLLQDSDGQVISTHSVAAGLDYPGVGPEHSFLRATGRVLYVSVSDDEALEGFEELARKEGIIPALESAHAVAFLRKLSGEAGYLPGLVREGIWRSSARKGRVTSGSESTHMVGVCLSGRGDKDVDQVMKGRETDLSVDQATRGGR